MPKSGLRRIAGRATRIARDWKRFAPLPARRQGVGPGVPNGARGAEFLIATKRGLFHWDDRGLFRVAPGEFYGVTRRAGQWYAFEKLGSTGRLVRFALARSGVGAFAELTTALSPGCHQIDFLGETLVVCDTYNNALRLFETTATGVVATGAVLPAGPLSCGRGSPNYAHLNSLWSDGRQTLVLFHNETAKTGRPSELAWLDRNLGVVEREALPAANAHNVLRYRGEPLYCDSQLGRLVLGRRAVFECDLFTRGLSVTENFLLVGASAYAKRDARSRLDGSVFVLTPDFSPVFRLSVPGMVQEIRCVNRPDLALSNDAAEATP